MKAVPILHELERRGIPRLFVHTGQHYDDKMSAALLTDLRAPKPDVQLDAGSASHAVQTARVMERFEPVLLEHRPSWVVVVGDVNSTLACALVTAKLRKETGSRIAHVEAGLRSGDWEMPEEVNRVLTDRLSDLLLKPSGDADEHIVREGLSDVRAEFVGNVMIDAMFAVLERGRALNMPARFETGTAAFALATLHRPSNVDDPERLALLLKALARIAERMRVVFPMHPRTGASADRAGLRDYLGAITVVGPLAYAEMVGALDAAAVVITDSGGVQQESTVLGIPCVTVREQTEWPVTLVAAGGTNRLIEWPPTVTGIVESAERAAAGGRRAVGAGSPKGWDGRAAERIVDALLSHA